MTCEPSHRACCDSSSQGTDYSPNDDYRRSLKTDCGNLEGAPYKNRDNNVVAIHPRGTTRVNEKFRSSLSGEDITLLDRLQVVQEVNRKWAKALNPFEYRLVSYILDRTIFWGRETFRACHDNIMNGTDDFAGVGMKRTKYLETLKSLEDRKVITRERARDYVVLGLNLDWGLVEEQMKSPVPKRVSEPGKDQKSATRTQNKENIDKGNNISAEPDGSRGEFDLDTLSLTARAVSLIWIKI